MPFNGSGIYTPPFLFVQDAANGIKILASRQDAQWSDITGALNNCLTRDSQGKPTQDWDANVHKIINLAPGVNPTDAMQLQQMPAPVTEWTPETSPVAFVSATSFKVTGVDHTSLYLPGRRVKITHNSGATVSYGQVTSSVFGTDTTVVVTMDTTALITTVTAVAYAFLSTNRSEPYLTFVKIYMTTATQALTANNEAKVLLNALSQGFDALLEANLANNRIVVKQAGLYLLTGGINSLNPASSTSLRGVIRVNGASDVAYTFVPTLDLTGQNNLSFPTALYVALANDYFEVFATAEANINLGGVVNCNCWLGVARIG